MALDFDDIQQKRNNTYRDLYRRTLGLLLIFSVTALCLGLIVAYKIWNPAQPAYYATTSNGDIVPMQSLSEPVVTNTYLLQWASLVARGAYNYDFVNWQDRMKDLSGYFTPQGWQSFYSVLQNGALKTAIDQKLQVSSVVGDAPVILNTGVVENYFTWIVQLPLLVTYTSASESRQQHLLVTMVIRRVPTLDTEKGIQVSSFIVKAPIGANG